ncbi:MAG: hypothetical protein JHC85_01290 [Chthoniobacterales bacterium]|nr:hypothetical protein [Chthoniobacterales bacterium]
MTIVAANGSQEFRRSRDGGESWALLSAKIAGEDIYPDDLELSSDGRVMAFHDGLRLFLSSDAGNTWSARTGWSRPTETGLLLSRDARSWVALHLSDWLRLFQNRPTACAATR